MLPFHVNFFTVYHGTNLLCAKLIKYFGIKLCAQRDMTDFGKGFYVTANLAQAKEWAQVKAQNPQIHPTLLEIFGFDKNDYLNHPETKIPAYLTFNLNLSKLLQLNGLIFPLPYDPHWHKYKEYWQDFVHNCRNGAKHQFDFVYGPVGSRHKGSFYQVKPTRLKAQLSLNSGAAIQCLANANISILPCMSLPSYHHGFRKNHNNFVLNHPFLKAILEATLSIGHLSQREAVELIQHSWAANQIEKRESVLGHEPPEYWAFFTLYESKKLWYPDYEAYLIWRQTKDSV